MDTGSKLLIVLKLKGLIVFISYPLIGLLADIKLTCYKMIRISCWVLLVFYAILSILMSILISANKLLH